MLMAVHIDYYIYFPSKQILLQCTHNLHPVSRGSGQLLYHFFLRLPAISRSPLSYTHSYYLSANFGFTHSSFAGQWPLLPHPYSLHVSYFSLSTIMLQADGCAYCFLHLLSFQTATVTLHSQSLTCQSGVWPATISIFFMNTCHFPVDPIIHAFLLSFGHFYITTLCVCTLLDLYTPAGLSFLHT